MVIVQDYKEQLKDTMGRYRTQSLFFETSQDKDTYEPIFTTKDQDIERNGKVLLSMKRLYLEISDPTEYDFAIQVLGSWRHWERLCNNAAIFSHIQEWRDELEIKIKSEAIRSLIHTANTAGAKGASAARYVAEKGWDKRKAGKPSKEEVQREAKIQAGLDSELEEDLKRINVH